jgi:c-di-GMP-binding flagellar brake protein YcgR
MRTQKRSSVRLRTDLPAELFPLQTIDQASEQPEDARGLHCRLADLSEGGMAVLIGGEARVGLPVKVQFVLGDFEVVMSGVVKGINFDQKKNRSLLHVQAAPPSAMVRNRILIYVYNLFGDRETILPREKPEAPPRDRAPDRIVLEASTQLEIPAEEAAGE